MPNPIFPFQKVCSAIIYHSPKVQWTNTQIIEPHKKVSLWVLFSLKIQNCPKLREIQSTRTFNNFEKHTAKQVFNSILFRLHNKPFSPNLIKLKNKIKPQTQEESHLLDDERTRGTSDYIDEIEVTISDFFDGQAVEVVAKLRKESWDGLYVVYKGLVVQWPELSVGHVWQRRNKRGGYTITGVWNCDCDKERVVLKVRVVSRRQKKKA